MSGFSNFAISFSIICILSGGINSFAQATSSVGGAGAGIGWIVGCVVSRFFAVAMAQIASAYPTAGGLYHWGSILGNRFTGWVTAWLNLLGLITVMGAINIGTAFFFIGTFGPLIGMTGTPGADRHLRRRDHGRAGADQPSRHQADGDADRLVGLPHLGDDDRIDRCSACIFAPTHECQPAVDLHQLSPVTPAAMSGRRATPWSICSRSACCCRSTRSPATTPRRTPPRKPSRPRTRCRAASSIRCCGRRSSAGSWSAAIVIAIPDMAEGAKQGWNVFFWHDDQRSCRTGW